MSPANRGTKTPGRGLLTAPHSLNGRNPDRARSSGSTENVSLVQRYYFAEIDSSTVPQRALGKV
jgi:hypothetical protein